MLVSFFRSIKLKTKKKEVKRDDGTCGNAGGSPGAVRTAGNNLADQ